MLMEKQTDNTLVEAIKASGGFMDVRQLEDGTVVGIGPLLYTTAIYVGMDLIGWNQRFCFDDLELAFSEYRKLRSGQDEPSGWIARRPQLPT